MLRAFWGAGTKPSGGLPETTSYPRPPQGQIPITVLDIPIIGTSPDHVAALVDRHRGRMSAADYSRAREAGTIEQQIGRYRLLADRGVGTVFVAFADLSGPAELERFSPIIEAFRRG